MQHTPPIVEEIDMGSLTGLFEFIAYQSKLGDADAQQSARDILRGVIENLPDTLADPSEALTLQALALGIAAAIETDPNASEHVRDLARYLALLIRAAGFPLELFAGALIDERRFFEHIIPHTSVQ